MGNKIFEFNGQLGQMIDQVTGVTLVNSGVVFKLGDKGLAGYMNSGDSLSLSGISVDVIDIISWAKGNGTLRITIGTTNTDIVLNSNAIANIKSTVILTSQTSITISCISGSVYVSKVALYSTSLTIDDDTEIQNDFLHTFSLAETKRNFCYEGLSVPEAEQVYYRNTFKYEKADGISTDIEDMVKGTGTYVVKTDAERNNYLECTVEGTEAFISEQAYGTWEFSFNLSDVAIGFQFTSLNIATDNTSNGYGIVIHQDGYIRLWRISEATKFQTADGYIQNNTWYRIKITRTTDGEFTVWIKGDSFGDVYTLVDTTGGLKTNPVTDNTYTTSKYSVFDVDAGDRISNILYRKGVVV